MKQSIINKLKEFFTLQPVEKVWLFGSYSRGEETRESDIDMVHGYYQIKDEIVWATIQTDLQPLREKIELYLQES